MARWMRRFQPAIRLPSLSHQRNHVLEIPTMMQSSLTDSRSEAQGASTATHILAIDDDAAIRKMVAEYLGENDLRVTAVETGAEMDPVLGEHAIDLVVLD